MRATISAAIGPVVGARPLAAGGRERGAGAGGKQQPAADHAVELR